MSDRTRTFSVRGSDGSVRGVHESITLSFVGTQGARVRQGHSPPWNRGCKGECVYESLTLAVHKSPTLSFVDTLRIHTSSHTHIIANFLVYA